MYAIRWAGVSGLFVAMFGCAGVTDFSDPLSNPRSAGKDATPSDSLQKSATASVRVFTAPAANADLQATTTLGEESTITQATVYYGSGAQGYYIYEPTGVSSAPVVAFFHGYQTLDPSNYGGWLKRLVDAKYIVVYPVYQDYVSLDTQYTDNALNAVKSAYTILAQSGHVHPAAGKFAVIGHSIGGVVGMNVAALAPSNGIPAPKMILMANPGDATSVLNLPSIMLSSYSAIPSTTRFIALVGDVDTVVGTQTGIDLFNRLPQIPTSQRSVIELMSDYLGLPPIIGQHGACLSTDPNFVSGPPPHVAAGPGANWTVGIDAATVAPLALSNAPAADDVNNDATGAQGRTPFQDPGGPVTLTIDTMDYKGYWAVGDALLNWAFHGATFSLPPGGPPKTMYMGNWSDGTPVKPAQILLP